MRLNIIQIDKKQNRQGDRPKDQRNDDPADPFPVEIGHTPLHGQQQNARHHNEQRHARTDQTSGERPGQKRGPILIELGNERIATVGEYHQKTRQHTQQIDPSDPFVLSQMHTRSIHIHTYYRFLRS